MSFSVPSDTIYIRHQNDLPAPVGGVITLPQNVVVEIQGQVDLDNDVQIFVPETTVIVGRDADTDGIVGNVNAPLIDTSNGLVVSNVFLRNFSVGADAFCIRTTTAGILVPRVSRIEGVSVGGTRGILIDTATAVGVMLLLDRTVLEGIVFRGTNAGVQILNQVRNSDALTPEGVVFDANSTTIATVIESCRYPLQTAGSVGIRKDPTATFVSVALLSNTFLILAPGATPLVGLTADGQIDVLFLGNYGIQNSKTGGSIGIDGNPAPSDTVIPGADTFVPVGNGNNLTHPIYTLDPSSSRVALSQVNGAPTGVLVLTANEPINAMVFAAVAARTVSGNPKAFSAQVVKNPGGGQEILTPRFTSVTGGAIVNSAGSLSFQTSTSMVTGDVLQLQVANRTDGDGLIIDSVNLSIMVATS